MIRPLRMIATRLQSSSTSASTWLESRIVIPSDASRFTSSRMSRIPAGSRPGRRLVEQQQLRVAQERRRDAEPLPHAVRVAADAVLRRDRAARRRRAPRRCASRRDAAVEIGEQPQVAAARQVRIEPRPLDEAGDAVERTGTVDERIAPEQPRAARRSDGSGRAACAATSSSRRRSGRGSRRRRRGRRSGRRGPRRRGRRSA